MATCATVLLLSPEWTVPPDDLAFRNAITSFLVLCLVAEAGFIRMGVDAATSSIAFLPLLASLLLFDPAWVMCIAGGSRLIAEIFIRRKAPIRVVHNSAKEIVAIGSAAHLYALLGGTASLDSIRISFPAFVAAVGVYFVMNQGASAVAISLHTGRRLGEAWARIVGSSLLYDFVAGPVSILLAVLYVRYNLLGLVVVLVPVFFIRHIYHINVRLEQVNRDLLELMVKAIEARDPYTSGHSLRVSKLARSIAQEYGLPSRRVELIATAALLHDVGKIYEEFATLLRKDGKLLPHEQRMMQSHPVRSAELVGTISIFRGEVEAAVRHHHERFDGTGYPDNLAADAIPVGSRIIAVADTVDAMTTDRPYRKALSYGVVANELQSCAGKQFDPEIVSLFRTSPKIQLVVDAHVNQHGEAGPKTVAETFSDLRRALESVPQNFGEAASTRWRRSRNERDAEEWTHQA